MMRVLTAVLLSPLGALLGAWSGQYLFNDFAMGHEYVTNAAGVAHDTGRRVPEPAFSYFVPSKISIPLALVTYVDVVLFAAPIASVLAKRGRFRWWVAVGLGAAFGILALGLFGRGYQNLGAQACGYAAFTGATAALYYWLLAYAGRKHAA
jgi:hypothetical protein